MQIATGNISMTTKIEAYLCALALCNLKGKEDVDVPRCIFSSEKSTSFAPLK